MLDAGKKVVFLTLGDPTIYSTFSYLQRIVEADGYETGCVSGIPSFCATAARINEPLVEFTFGEPAQIQKQSPSRTSDPLPYPVTAAKPAARHKTPKSKISEDQILLFKIA